MLKTRWSCDVDILSFAIGLAVGVAVAAVLIAAAGDLLDKFGGHK